MNTIPSQTTANAHGRLKNGIILCGNGGVGKSYISNRIFARHSVATRFKSSASLRTVTSALQWDQITRQGVDYTIIDTPGFFDNSDLSLTAAQVDGENLCKLVAAMETCDEIVALVFVLTGRFLEPEKQWLDRLKLLMTPGRVGQILILHNKIAKNTTPTELAHNAIEMTGKELECQYFSLSFDPSDQEVDNLMALVCNICPFKISKMAVPHLCYTGVEEVGPPFQKIIPNSQTTKDEGKMVTVTTHGYQILTDHHVGGREYGLFGPRERWTTTRRVPTTTTRQEWQKKMVTRHIKGTFVRVTKIRWDGTKDVDTDRETDVSLREDEIISVVETPISTEETAAPPPEPCTIS